jgi:hypothetical protein
MRRALQLSLLTYAFYAWPVLGAELIRPTLEVNDMRVIVAYVSVAELVSLQAKYGNVEIDRRDIRQDHRTGFSILRTNRQTGARTCEIYLPDAKRPKEVDDEATLILGHELLHCMLGDYHR